MVKLSSRRNRFQAGLILNLSLVFLPAEATGRVLACRLYNMTADAGMKEMLKPLIARDTMHQQQWLAVLEELGGYKGTLPIPNSFPQSEEDED